METAEHESYEPIYQILYTKVKREDVEQKKKKEEEVDTHDSLVHNIIAEKWCIEKSSFYYNLSSLLL